MSVARDPARSGRRWIALLVSLVVAVVGSLWLGAPLWLIGAVAIIVAFGGGALLFPMVNRRRSARNRR